MSDQEREQEDNIKRNNTKIAVTAIFSVLLGVAFILTLILFGMSAQRDYDNMRQDNSAKVDKGDDVVSIIGLEYSSASFKYNTLKTTDDGEEVAEQKSMSCLLSASGLGDETYAIIDSNDKLNSLVSNLRDMSGDEALSYSVDENFLLSGTIIAVVSESGNPDSIEAKSVVRDEDYNVQVNVKVNQSEAELQDDDSKPGVLTLIKIRNVQPKKVSVIFE